VSNRTIWIIRHGKSAAADPAQRDFDRPLNKRGRGDGSSMLQWYAQQSEPASWVWTSPAVRAQATAEFVGSGFNAPVVEEHSLYLGSANALLSCLQSTPDEVDSVAIVAHNPGATHLVNLLGDKEVTSNLVTFGTARFTTDSAWPMLQFGGALLVELYPP